MDSQPSRPCPRCSYVVDADDTSNHVTFHWLLDMPFDREAFEDLDVEVGSLRYTLSEIQEDWTEDDVNEWLEDELSVSDRMKFLMPFHVSVLSAWLDGFLVGFHQHLASLREYYYGFG